VEPNPLATEEAPPPYSSKTAEAIDAEVQALISAAYARAGKLLNEHRDKLELLAATLLEKETMDGREVEKLLGFEKSRDDDTPSEAPSEAPSETPANEEANSPS
jgi:cell division protease FtsH